MWKKYLEQVVYVVLHDMYMYSWCYLTVFGVMNVIPFNSAMFELNLWPGIRLGYYKCAVKGGEGSEEASDLKGFR
jgi:hypothetical protein